MKLVLFVLLTVFLLFVSAAKDTAKTDLSENDGKSENDGTSGNDGKSENDGTSGNDGDIVVGEWRNCELDGMDAKELNDMAAGVSSANPVVAIECGLWPVPLSHTEVAINSTNATSSAAMIHIHIQRVRKANATGQLWFLTGGPGQGGADAWDTVKTYLDATRPLAGAHDFYLPDHRGTGMSNKLECHGDHMQYRNDKDARDFARNCTASLRAAGTPLRHFTSDQAARDIVYLWDTYPPAAGMKVFIHAIAYGTVLARRVASMTNRTSGIVLESSLNNEWRWNYVDFDAETAGSKLMELCREDATCRSFYGSDPYKTLEYHLSFAHNSSCANWFQMYIWPDMKGFLRRALAVGAVDGADARVNALITVYRTLRCNFEDLSWLEVSYTPMETEKSDDEKKKTEMSDMPITNSTGNMTMNSSVVAGTTLNTGSMQWYWKMLNGRMWHNGTWMHMDMEEMKSDDEKKKDDPVMEMMDMHNMHLEHRSSVLETNIMCNEFWDMNSWTPEEYMMAMEAWTFSAGWYLYRDRYYRCMAWPMYSQMEAGYPKSGSYLLIQGELDHLVASDVAQDVHSKLKTSKGLIIDPTGSHGNLVHVNCVYTALNSFYMDQVAKVADNCVLSMLPFTTTPSRWGMGTISQHSGRDIKSDKSEK